MASRIFTLYIKYKLYNRFYPKKHMEYISTAVVMLYLG